MLKLYNATSERLLHQCDALHSGRFLNAGIARFQNCEKVIKFEKKNSHHIFEIT